MDDLLTQSPEDFFAQMMCSDVDICMTLFHFVKAQAVVDKATEA